MNRYFFMSVLLKVWVDDIEKILSLKKTIRILEEN